MYLSVQATLDALLGVVAPDDEIVNLVISHTVADSADPDSACPQYK
jgi:hypothetical protein